MFVFLSLSLFSVIDAFYDGRLYRCGIKFSGEDLNETSDAEANIASVSSPDCQQESDDDGWEEREASRTHSVKFTEDLDQDLNKETPFVRQNTPHPKELKAKAHKLFGKTKAANGKTPSEQQIVSTGLDVEAPADEHSTYAEHPEQKAEEDEPKEINRLPIKQVMMSQESAILISHEQDNQITCEDQETESEEDVEKEVSEMEVDDADEDLEETEKHVGFEVEDEEDAGARPNRLHRRDTPHHLKNKRINVNLDHTKVASIIAQVN
ncbi:hypothetical protein C0J52_22299 [Blattella germanica]|nr:hypothetical protein C0J52_22299 [Blattella germanica]